MMGRKRAENKEVGGWRSANFRVGRTSSEYHMTVRPVKCTLEPFQCTKTAHIFCGARN